jgi:hypothetical protein
VVPLGPRITPDKVVEPPSQNEEGVAFTDVITGKAFTTTVIVEVVLQSLSFAATV